MFAAIGLNDRRKGADLLVKALKSIPASMKGEMLLLTLGENKHRPIGEAVDIQTINLGYLTDDSLKAIGYSAADIFIFPTRADTFGLVLIESMACGTPIVSFNVGGVPDIVRPGITGHLAEAEDVGALRDGIVRFLEDDSFRERISRQCRIIAESEYSIKLQANRHIQLYSQLLNN